MARHRDSVYWGRPCRASATREARLLRAGAGTSRPRRQPQRSRLHRRQRGRLRRDALRGAASRRLLTPAALGGPGGRTAPDDCYIAAVNRCAPPANKPTTEERDNCLPFLVRELRLLPLGARDARPRRVCLGRRAAGPRRARAMCVDPSRSSGMGLRRTSGRTRCVGCYHPSQQNTFTGRLTTGMLDDVLARAPGSPPPTELQADRSGLTFGHRCGYTISHRPMREGDRSLGGLGPQLRRRQSPDDARTSVVARPPAHPDRGAGRTSVGAGPTIEVFAEGLEHPRGIDDRRRWQRSIVAEAGVGGDTCPDGRRRLPASAPPAPSLRIIDGGVERIVEGSALGRPPVPKSAASPTSADA